MRAKIQIIDDHLIMEMVLAFYDFREEPTRS